MDPAPPPNLWLVQTLAVDNRIFQVDPFLIDGSSDLRSLFSAPPRTAWGMGRPLKGDVWQPANRNRALTHTWETRVELRVENGRPLGHL